MSAEATSFPNRIRPLIEAAHCALDLHRKIVGVTFFSSANDYDRSPEALPTRPISFCIMVKLAAMGRSLKAGEEQINCPGATRALGLTRPDADFKSGDRYFSFQMYEDLETAKATTDTVCLIPEDVRGVAVKPLSLHHRPPDVVILICNPYQAMRILQGYAYHFGPPPKLRCNGMQGVCSELAARALQKQALSVSLLCSGTRFSCTWKDAELGVGMPFSMFPDVFDGVLGTINGADSDKTKKRILARSEGVPARLDVKPGTAYYWRGKALRRP